MKLSVLICSVPSRVNEFGILAQLVEQTKGQEVEIIYLGDNWKQTIGEKRNNLVNMAKGEYVTFVDDDDSISDNYISSILEAIKKGSDVICYWLKITQDKSQTWKNVTYSKDFIKDRNLPDRFERLPNHLMVFKRSLMIPFRSINMGEDFIFANEIRKRLQTQTIIKQFLYFYHADRERSESVKRNNRI